jgi:hypothetical protein
MPQGYVKLVRQVVSASTSVFRVFFSYQSHLQQGSEAAL